MIATSQTVIFAMKAEERSPFHLSAISLFRLCISPYIICTHASLPVLKPSIIYLLFYDPFNNMYVIQEGKT